MTYHIKHLLKYPKYQTFLTNLISKSGARYVLTVNEIHDILLKNQDKRDSFIYDIFRKYMINTISNKTDVDYTRSRMRKATIRYNEIMKISNIGDMQDFQRYLDFGAGDCSMAVLLGKCFGIDQIYAVDIKGWEGVLTDPGIYRKQCKFKEYDGLNIPYKDDSFDLITSFQVLHHIDDIIWILAELHRILCKGGIFIIREHNCHNSKMRRLIEIEHELHDKVFNSEINHNEAYSCYRTKKLLKRLITDIGFKYIGQHCMDDSVWNPTRYYYQAFQKV